MVRQALTTILFAACVVNAATVRDAVSQPVPSIPKPKNAEALDHLAKGNKLYNVRSFAEAADEYKAGALIESAPIFDYNLGQCYRQLGKYEDAIWHYQRFVKSSPQVTQHVDAANKFVTQMQDELSKKAMTAPPTDPAPTGPTSTTTTQPVAPIEPPVEGTNESEEATPWYRDRLGLGLSIGGLAATGIATGLLISGKSLNDQANASTSQREREDLFDRAETRSTIGVVTMIGGGALLVAGIVMLAIPDTEKQAERTSISLGLQPSGISFYGRF